MLRPDANPAFGDDPATRRAFALLSRPGLVATVQLLRPGPRSAPELRLALPRAAGPVLEQILGLLLAEDLVEPTFSTGRRAYRLTPAGRALGPVIDHLAAWSVRSVHVEPELAGPDIQERPLV